MPRISVEPSDRASTKSTYIRTITATDNGKTVGKTIWTFSPTQPGAIQIISIEVDPTLVRQGIGSRMLTRLFDESTKRSKSLGIQLRRVWIVIEQKTHITARGFLTKHGFHHVKTIDALFKDEAAMVYVKSFD